MYLEDHRTTEQKRVTHTTIVLATDRFQSGWGEARNGKVYVGWACRPENAEFVENWVRARLDTEKVRVVEGNYRPPTNIEGTCRICAVGENHPALQEGRENG